MHSMLIHDLLTRCPHCVPLFTAAGVHAAGLTDERPGGTRLHHHKGRGPVHPPSSPTSPPPVSSLLLTPHCRPDGATAAAGAVLPLHGRAGTAAVSLLPYLNTTWSIQPWSCGQIITAASRGSVYKTGSWLHTISS